jgi:hypothetical protein
MDQDRTLNDDTLEHEIEAALAVDPSPEFLARVRTRLASEPAPFGWRLSWMYLGALGLTTAVVLALVLTRLERQPVPAAATPTITPPMAKSESTGRALGETVPFPSIPADSVVTTVERIPRRQALATAQPEVIISDAAALRVLVVNTREGRIDPAGLNALNAVATPLEPLGTISIQPITIEPLPQLALLEGERQ